MERTTRTLMAALAALLLAAGCAANSRAGGVLDCMDRFALNRFVTGAWTIGNDFSDAYAARFAAAGLDTMVDAPTALDQARKHGIHVLITTELHPVFEDQKLVPGRFTVGEFARVPDLKWLHEHFGRHPALAGYLLNDAAGVPAHTADCAAWLKDTAPRMVPLAATGSERPANGTGKTSLTPLPILATRQTAFTDGVDRSEEDKRQLLCNRLEADRSDANAGGLCLWPVLGVLPTMGPELGASQLRFAAYTALAYGAQGIFYSSFSLNPAWGEKGELFQTVRDVNQHIRSIIGPRALGCRSVTVFHSPGPALPRGARLPGPGQLIESMDASLLAGVLVPESRLKAGDSLPAYVMLVDTRTDSHAAAEPPVRTVTVTFGGPVKAVELLGRPGAAGTAKGRTITAQLRAGDGVFLRITD